MLDAMRKTVAYLRARVEPLAKDVRTASIAGWRLLLRGLDEIPHGRIVAPVAVASVLALGVGISMTPRQEAGRFGEPPGAVRDAHAPRLPSLSTVNDARANTNRAGPAAPRMSASLEAANRPMPNRSQADAAR